MALPVTSLYAALLAGLFVFLSIRVVGARRRHGVALGSGGHRALERAQRAQGNCAEYVPIAVLLLALLEGLGLAAWAVHLLGLALLAGRGLHAFGISREPEVLRFRVTGMALTFGVIAIGAVTLLVLALLHG